MKIKYVWEKFDNPKLDKLKKEYELEKVVSSEKNEFERQLILKDWVYKTLHRGKPGKDYSKLSAFEILDDNKIGKKFWCTQFTQVYLQCATALGWYVRKLSIDCDHAQNEKSYHHGICDIWSNKYKKWIVIDPYNNLHFEKNNIPLCVLEIRNEYLKNKAKNVVGILGNNVKNISYDKDSVGEDTLSNYFWFFISLRNNFLDKPGLFDTGALLWVDEYNKDKFWYKDGKLHPMYDSQFIKTGDEKLCFLKIR